MNAGMIAIAALGGFIVYDKVLAPGGGTGPAAPNSQKYGPFSSLFNIGSQPQTGNGQNADNVASDIAKGAGSLFKFGSDLLQYFGTADKDSGSTGTSRDDSVSGDYLSFLNT